MDNLAKYNFFTQESSLSELQQANVNGLFTESLLIYILVVIFVILMIAYFIWIKKLNK